MGGLKIQVNFPEVEVEEYKREYAEWMKDESIDQKLKTDSNFVRVYYMNRVALRRGAPIGNQNAASKADADKPVSQSLELGSIPHGQDSSELKSEGNNQILSSSSANFETSIGRESNTGLSDDLETLKNDTVATERELSNVHLSADDSAEKLSDSNESVSESASFETSQQNLLMFFDEEIDSLVDGLNPTSPSSIIK